MNNYDKTKQRSTVVRGVVRDISDVRTDRCDRQPAADPLRGWNRCLLTGQWLPPGTFYWGDD